VNTLRLSFIIISVLFSTQLLAADKLGTLTRDTELRKAPSKSADIITILSADNKVRILNRQGGWYQVNNGIQAGWVRLLTVKLYRKNTIALPTPKNTDEEDEDDLLGNLATGREQSDEVTAATAVRGIDEEVLQNAEPDQEALKLLDQYAADASTGQAAAEEVGLKNKKLDYFGADKKPTPAPKPKVEESDDDQGDWP